MVQPSVGVAQPSVGVVQQSVGMAQPGVELAQPGVRWPSKVAHKILVSAPVPLGLIGVGPRGFGDKA